MLAKHEGKRPLGNPMRKLEEMLNSNFKTQGGWLAGGEGGDLAQHRDRQCAIVNIWVPCIVANLLTIIASKDGLSVMD